MGFLDPESGSEWASPFMSQQQCQDQDGGMQPMPCPFRRHKGVFSSVKFTPPKL